jgi:hypothetical protein
MKNIIKNIALAATACTLLASCEDFFSQVVTLNIPPQKNVIVVNSLLNTDSVIRLEISNSVPALGIQQDPKTLRTAQITLTADGTPITDIRIDSTEYFDQNGSRFVNYFYKSLNTKPIAGKTYALTVAAPGYETVDATYKMPQPIPLTNITVEPLSRTLNGEDYHRITFTLPDNATQKDFYEFGLGSYSKDTTTNMFVSFNGASFYSKDVALRENRQTDPFGGDDETVLGVRYWRNALFTDTKFDGTNKVIEIFIESRNFNRDGSMGGGGGNPAIQQFLNLYLYNYSIESYRYILQTEAQQESSDNPFADPVQVVTNINKGLGIFAGKTQYNIRIN